VNGIAVNGGRRTADINRQTAKAPSIAHRPPFSDYRPPYIVNVQIA